MNNPIVYQLPSIESKTNILSTNADIKVSKTINYPKFQYGFNHFIYSTKDKMEVTIGKKKFYYVVNPYEHTIDKYESSLDNVTQKYFELKNKPDILSRAFYKLWEIIFMFNLIPDDQKNFTSAHLAEGPGSFIQAVIYYREKFCKPELTKGDKLFGITLHKESKNVPEMERNFIKSFDKKFNLHRTVDINTAKNNKYDNGDITDVKTINNFYNTVKSSGKLADLVTADGGFVWKNENFQEQEAYVLLFGEIIGGLRVQAEGGNFIIKFFESYTNVTIKFLNILQIFYDNVFIVKPLTSRTSNSEKYIVCSKLLKIPDFDKKIKILENLLEKMKQEKAKGYYIIDIFPDYKIPSELEKVVLHSNMDITNNQMIMINQIVDYINGGNYYGEKYNAYREKQIEATENWIKTFYPKNNLKDIKNNIQKETIKIIENNKKIITSK